MGEGHLAPLNPLLQVRMQRVYGELVLLTQPDNLLKEPLCLPGLSLLKQNLRQAHKSIGLAAPVS